jgi:hypothetical protein
MDPDPDPGGLKSCGSGFGSGSETLLVTGTDLVSEIPEAEDVLLLDLAEDREEGRLHSVTVQRVLPCLNNPSC